MPELGRAHTAPRTAVVWAVLRAELDRHPGVSLRVLDAGGGSGQFAVPLAELGHQVTVVDASPDALAALERRAAERAVAGRVTGVQGDADTVLQVVGPATQDLVLCHSLLEIVDEPAAVLGPIAQTVRAGGCASVLVANRNATVLSRALGGHLADAVRALDDPAGRWGEADAVLRRYDLPEVTALLSAAGLHVEAVHGVRVVADLVPGILADAETGGLDALLELELAASVRSPFRDIATQLHLLARRH
ncbi:MAG: methyltransferase domain-containing protein [Actinomycetota bacterium]|nr:methyltransferase domain-containing protein [Actinomycetota bacterium]